MTFKDYDKTIPDPYESPATVTTGCDAIYKVEKDKDGFCTALIGLSPREVEEVRKSRSSDGNRSDRGEKADKPAKAPVVRRKKRKTDRTGV